MDLKPSLLTTLLLLMVITLTASLAANHEEEDQEHVMRFVAASDEPITPSHPLHPTHQKLTHVRFYWHDIQSGRRPTSIPVAKAATTNSSQTLFGLVNMIDDPLTLGPDVGSALVGRAQGLYASASQETVGLIMAMNFMFLQGKYNGSTITVVGRNEVFTGMREMAVVGGSGLFRWARGYVQARTHKFDPKTGDAVVHYDCFIMHY